MKNKGFEAFEIILKSIINYFKIIVIIALILLMLSGIYVVDSGEAAVVLRFGKLAGSNDSKIKSPGLHYAFPYIVDEVIKVPVGKVHEIQVDTHNSGGSRIYPNLRSNGYLLTGDENIILLRIIIKYKIDDAAAYALYIKDVGDIIDGVASGELVSLVAGMDVDSVLTDGKENLSRETQKNLQSQLDHLQCGINITNIELTSISPPRETRKYFDEVNAASVKKETKIREAEEYKASAIPKAQGNADQLIRDANINQSNMLIRANQEVAEFEGLYNQYAQNPRAVMDGTFRKRIGQVLTQMGAEIIIPNDGSPKIILP